MSGVSLGVVVGAAFLGGIVNSIAGGGTLLMYPSLVAIGLPSVSANVTTTVAAWPGYLTGAASYRSQLSDKREVFTLGASAVGGGVIGTVLLLTTSTKTFSAVVPFLVLAASALLAAQPFITKWLSKRRQGQAHGRIAIPATILAATYGAYFGGGLGIILLATLALCLDRPLNQLNGLKTMLALAANSVALIGFGLLGPVHWGYVALMAPSSFVGGIVGARVAQRLNPQVLRTVVVAFGCCVGVRLLMAG